MTILTVLLLIGTSFLLGDAYATSKYVRKQRKHMRRIQILENFKHAVKVLCPKIKDGEKITQGHPDDA